MKTKEEIEKLANDYGKSVGNKDGTTAFDFKLGYNQCQEDTERVICQNCEFVITTNDINKHLFIKVKGGGLIHWNCDDCEKLNKQD
jgi:hypothetical protein